MNGNVAWRNENRSSCSVSQLEAARISIAIFKKKCKRGSVSKRFGSSEQWVVNSDEENFSTRKKHGLIGALLRMTTSGLRRNARAEHEFGEKSQADGDDCCVHYIFVFGVCSAN